MAFFYLDEEERNALCAFLSDNRSAILDYIRDQGLSFSEAKDLINACAKIEQETGREVGRYDV